MGHSFATLPEIASMNWVLSDHQTVKLDTHRNTPSSNGSGIHEFSLEQVMEAQVSFRSWSPRFPGVHGPSSRYIASSLSTTVKASWRKRQHLSLFHQRAYNVFWHHHSPEESAISVPANRLPWTVSTMEGNRHGDGTWIFLHGTHLFC